MTTRALRQLTAILCLLAWVAIGESPSHAQLKMSPPRATGQELEQLAEQFKQDPTNTEICLAYARALAEMESITGRRRAVRVLREGLRHHPDSVDLRIALGDLYFRQGFYTLSRQQLEKALEYSPNTGPAYARLGRMAFRDWLKYQRSDALRVAGSLWEHSTNKNPDDAESWLGIGILALLQKNYPRAEECARTCLDVAQRLGQPTREQLGLFTSGSPSALPDRATRPPDIRGEAWLMLGAAAYEQGKMELSQNSFHEAFRYLPPRVRSHILDIGPMATHLDTVILGTLRNDSGKQMEFLRQYWRARDPDLTTQYNEVQLEFFSRGAMAYFLYYNQRREAWDERGQIVKRYGMPGSSVYNPPTMFAVPMSTNRLVWTYPMLGMNVYLEDRFLNEFYDLPISLNFEVDPRPMPEIVRGLSEIGEVTVAGRGVFRAREPGTGLLPGDVRPAMFRRVRTFDPSTGVARGPQVGRLELYLTVEDSDRLGPVSAEAVVFDSDWREIGRFVQGGMSWCASEKDQVAQFNFELPAGSYMVGVSARDDSSRARSSWRIPIQVDPPLPGKLEMSDIEIACEFIPEKMGGAFDKSIYAIVPSPRNEVRRDRPLGIYYEIYGLVPEADGYSRVSVEYTVRSVDTEKRPFFLKIFNPKRGQPRVRAVRTDDTPGRARFQYVSTDLESPEPGLYELEIVVKDEESGQRVSKTIEFTVVP